MFELELAVQIYVEALPTAVNVTGVPSHTDVALAVAVTIGFAVEVGIIKSALFQVRLSKKLKFAGPSISPFVRMVYTPAILYTPDEG